MLVLGKPYSIDHFRAPTVSISGRYHTDCLEFIIVKSFNQFILKENLWFPTTN
jgi:hypothetical protein